MTLRTFLFATGMIVCAAAASSAQPDVIHSRDLATAPTLVPPQDPVKAAAATATTDPDSLSIQSERGKPLVVPPRNSGKPRTPEPLAPRTVFDTPEAAIDAVNSLEESAYVGAPQIVSETSGIRYVSGGIGKQERLYIKSLEPDFKLKLTFAAATGHFLSDVTVNISNAKGESVLTLVTQGPHLLVDLPAGSYRVDATYQEVTVSKPLTVATALRTYPITFTGPVM